MQKLPQLTLRDLFWLVALVAMGCSGGSSPTVSRDRFVKLVSEAGNSITVPSQWTSDDQGDTWLLDSPDGHERIAIFTNTVKGSGDIEQYSETMLASFKASDPIEEIMARGTKVEIGKVEATRYEFEQLDGEGRVMWVYILRNGDLYHLITVTASKDVIDVNGGFYEEVVRSFVGIDSLPE